MTRRVRPGAFPLAIASVVAVAGCQVGPTPSPPTSTPSASPSGSAAEPVGRIAFTRIVAAEGQPTAGGIWIVGAAGGTPEPLIDGPGIETFPAWSPDGTRIAYVVGPTFADGDIWIANADGSDARQLTDRAGREWAPAWSPDGRRIAYVTTDEGSQVWTDVVDEDVPPRAIVPAHWPSWSPEGDQLVITVGDSFSTGALAAIDLIEGNTRALPIALPNASEGTIAPDGRVAFVSSATDYADQDPGTWNEDIWLFTPGGDAPVQLTFTPGNDHWPPTFSPDGRWLAYTSDALPPETTGRIALVPAAGGEPRYLTDGAAYDGFPAWQPIPEAAG